MRKLLSDSLIAKYRALPDFVWVLFAALSIFFANAYNFIVSATLEYLPSFEQIAESLSAQNNATVTVNAIAVIAFSCILSTAFHTLIFEVINHIVAGVFLSRFSAKTNRSDIKFRLRVCYIYSNLLIGLVGIAYFFTQTTNGVYTGVFDPFSYEANDVANILSSIVPFSSLTATLFFFYEDLRIRFLPVRNHTRALLFVGRIYFGIELFFTLLQALGTVVMIASEISVITMIAQWVEFVVCAVWAVLCYLYYQKLKKSPSDNDDNNNNPNVTIIIDQPQEHNIYDDFGF